MKQNNIITLTTDFGLSDPFVGIMKGVMFGITSLIQLIDISHLIEPQNIIQAYYTLKFSYKYFPSGTIHLSVVDPGVGSERRPILIESKDYFFIEPDNPRKGHICKCSRLRRAPGQARPAPPRAAGAAA